MCRGVVFDNFRRVNTPPIDNQTSLHNMSWALNHQQVIQVGSEISKPGGQRGQQRKGVTAFWSKQECVQ